jgi:hypothetical protein
MVYKIDLYEALKMQFTEEQAKVMVKAIEKLELETEVQIDKAFDVRKDVLATKNDISLIGEDMAKMESRLIALIANSKAEIIKWSFIFWVGQVMIFAGLFIAIFLKLK